MRLPALAIASAFVAGIALLGPLPMRTVDWTALALAAMLGGFLCLRRRRLKLGLACGLVAWTFLGALAARLEKADVPANHVTALLDSGQLDASQPLRWRGRLRSDPQRLPWGYRYEIALDEVELVGRPLATLGGLRLSHFQNERDSENEGGARALPQLRAGDRVEALVRARPPRNFANPGAFDARGHLARQGVHLTGSLRSAELLQKIGESSSTLGHRMARIRGHLLERVDALFRGAPEHQAVLRAMLLGDSNFVNHELAEPFQQTGVYHVVVISGMHVAALAAFVLWFGRRLRLSLLATTLVTLAVLATFVAIVEDRPPILRAALMSGVFLSTRLLFRRVELLNTIAVAALLLLLVRPSDLADASFQLSFLAAAMIGGLAAPWVERTSGPYRRALEHLGDVTRDASHPPRATQFRLDLRAAAGWLKARVPRAPTWLASRAASALTDTVRAALLLWEVFLVSAATQLGLLAVMAHYFHRVSLSGLLANIPAVILSGLMVPLGFLTLALAAAWEPAGNLLASPLGWLTALLLGTVKWFGGWQSAVYRIPGPPTWLLLAFFAALVLLAITARAEKRRWQWLLAAPFAALALAVATHPFAPRLEAGQLELTVLDVGQGDAIFVAFPGGRTMLIDAGGAFGTRRGGYRAGFDIGEDVVSPYLWHRGLERLDAVALTHAHQDHLDGVPAVLNNFRVAELWVGRDVDTPAYRALLETARARGTQIVRRRRGDSFRWEGVTGLVLWPEKQEPVAAGSNNDSLVLRLELGGDSFLLPGDIERPVERELVERGDPLDADVLKVPHHGSRTSTTQEFLDQVTPCVAAISLGENNPFGHPHPDVLGRLAGHGRRTLRTDRDGAITLLSDGRRVRMTTPVQNEEVCKRSGSER